MATSVGELSVKLGFDVADKALKAFDESIGGLSNKMLGAVAGGTLLADTLGEIAKNAPGLVTHTFDAAAGWQQLAIQTQIARDELQKYAAAAASLSGGTMTDLGAGAAIANVDKTLNNLRRGLGDALTHQATEGISLDDKNSLQFLMNFRKRAKELNLSEQRIAQDLRLLGYGEGFTKFILADEKPLNDLVNQLALTKEEIDKNADAQQALAIEGAKLNNMWVGWVADVLPKVRQGISETNNYFKDMGNTIGGVLDKMKSFEDKKIFPKLQKFNEGLTSSDKPAWISDLAAWNNRMTDAVRKDNNLAPLFDSSGRNSTGNKYADKVTDIKNIGDFLPPVEPYSAPDGINTPPPQVNITNQVTVHTTDSGRDVVEDWNKTQLQNVYQNTNNGAAR